MDLEWFLKIWDIIWIVKCNIMINDHEIKNSCEQIEELCNPNLVQIFYWVIWSDPNLVDLSKYLIQSGLYLENTYD